MQVTAARTKRVRVARFGLTAQPAQYPQQSQNQQQNHNRDASCSTAAHVIQEDFYDWKYGTRVRYMQAGSSGPPLLLVHGFGVGCYHWNRNIPHLAQQHRVYAVDLVGQGGSWPAQWPIAADQTTDGPLCYSADTWTEQLHHFIQQHIGQPVYLVGNSLGGYLGVHLASKHPEDVRGLFLLNATPFWAFWPPPDQAKGLWKLLAVNAAVPVPQVGYRV